MDLTRPAVTYRRLTVYFIPLALQAASQSLTYPLVAAVASRGPGGTLNLAGVAQSNLIMFLVGTLGAGLVTSGMVYGSTERGFRKFVSVNNVLSFTSATLQALICIPVVAHFVFATLLGLPASIEAPARDAFPLTIIMNLLFFWRNPYQVLLYNNGASGRAMLATFLRIGGTLGLAPVLCGLGLVGPQWAIICQTVPLAGEVFLSWYFSRPMVNRFRPEGQILATSREILRFNVPLSLGGFLMTLSGMLLGAFIARAPEPERMLPAYYLALGVVNPVAYAAGRVQNVVLCFPPLPGTSDRTLKFSLAAGALVSLIPLLFLLPGPAQWYYVSMQRLQPGDLPLVAVTSLLLFAYPLCIALRAHREGLAALQRRTSTILAGNVAFLASLAVIGVTCLSLGAPGNIIGPVVLVLSNLLALGILVLLLREAAPPDQPPAPVQMGQEG